VPTLGRGAQPAGNVVQSRSKGGLGARREVGGARHHGDTNPDVDSNGKEVPMGKTVRSILGTHGSALDLPGWLFFVIGVTIDHAFLFLKLSFPSVARVLPLWTSILHDPGVELAKQWMILDLYATRNALAINRPAVCLLANLPPLDLVGFLIHDFFPLTWTVVNILIHLEKLYN
jgi:hypothetical protein